MKHVIVQSTLVILAVCLAPAKLLGEISVATMPPAVVKTVPRSGDKAVDPSITEIRVTFSKEMMDGNWSWTQISDETFPETTGKPRYLDDKRTCVLPVKLQPGKTYVTWLNSAKFGNFKDTDSRSAVPYLLVFETARQEKTVAETVGQAVTTISGCAEGDPKVAAELLALKGLDQKVVVAETAKFLGSEKPTVRRAAVYILWRGQFRSIEAALPELQKLCRHSEDLTRGMAALALGGNRVADTFPQLVEMAAKDESSYARRCAAYALGLLGVKDAVPVLQKVLASDTDPLVKNNARAALTLLASDVQQPEKPDDDVGNRSKDDASNR